MLILLDLEVVCVVVGEELSAALVALAVFDVDVDEVEVLELLELVEAILEEAEELGEGSTSISDTASNPVRYTEKYFPRRSPQLSGA